MAKKNALQSALNLVKGGALRAVSATPAGQLASRVAQAASFLRAPSMEEFGNAYNQSVGRASSFVQKYQTPPPQQYAREKFLFSPAETFKENVRFLTTETPAARLLFKQYTPLQYQEPESFQMKIRPDVKPTVGKFVAGTFEDVVPALMPIAPYAPAIVSGLRAVPGLIPKIAATAVELATFNPRMKTRNILKQGLNIPAGAVGGSIAMGLQSGLKFLKGEKMSKEELVAAGILGFGIGSVAPSPMKGISTTELGKARGVLSKYGFELKDYESPAILKVKFNRFMLANHPDKFLKDPSIYQQKTGEFKMFVDAFNKATSAGVEASWKLPDLRSWLRNLWARRQQPKPGTMMRVGQPTPSTVTGALFSKIATLIQKESGIGSHVFEGPQIRSILKKTGFTTLPEGTVETPTFIIQYLKKDPVTGQPIIPRLVVNIFPEAQPVPRGTPQVAPTPSVQPITPVPQVPKTPVQPLAQAMGGEIGKGVKEVPVSSFEDESLNPLSEEYIREIRKTVNENEKMKLAQMKNSEINAYVTQQQSMGGVSQTQIPITEGTLRGIAKHAKENGGITVDFQGNIKDSGYAFSVMDKADESRLTIDDNFDRIFIDKFNELKAKYENNPANHMGGWIDKGQFVVDVSHVSNDLKQSLYDAISKKQDAIGDLGKYAKGENGDIFITPEIINSLQPLGRGSLGSGKSSFSNWEEVADYYNKKDFKNAPEIINSEEYKSLLPVSATQQVTPLVPQAPPVQPVRPLAVEGKKRMRGFVKTVLESDVAEEEWKKDIIEKVRLYYRQKGNEQTLDNAENLIAQDREGTIIRVLDLNERGEDLHAAGQLLAVQLQDERNFGRANQLLDALAEKSLLSGREGQIAAVWDKLSPTGRVQYAREMVDKVIKKLSPLDKKVNKISYLEESPQIASTIAREMNEVNRNIAEAIAKEVVDKFQKTVGRTIKEKADPQELLGQRIIRYAKTLLTAKERKNDPITNMINALYRVALETLPPTKPKPKDPLVFIAEAIRNKEEYRNVWEMAQDIVKEKFQENLQALDVLDDYFAAYLEKPFSQAQLNQLVAKRIKGNEIDLGQVVRDYYVDKQKRVGETLASRLTEEAGLTDEDARTLEKYVTQRFDELTTKKKEQILIALAKEKPKLEQKPFLQKVVELSNLGAFSDKRYYDLIAKRLNIPNISEEMAQDLFTTTQRLQTIPDGKERDKLVIDITNLISDQVPPGISDIFDAYRYQNILSNPRTFLMRNPYWNFLQATVFVPLELTGELAFDYLASTLTRTPRQVYASIPAYYRGLINAIPEALDTAMKVWKGTLPIESPDLRQIKFRAIQRKFPRLTIIPRLMEIGDQLFRTLISRAYSASLQAGGLPKDIADQAGIAEALDVLLRRKLDPKDEAGRGPILSGLDRVGNGIMEIRKGAPPVGWIVPFVTTPLQFAQMNLQYVPLFGPIETLTEKIGGGKTSDEQKRKQIARGMIGAIAMLIATSFAVRGKTTWKIPEDEEQRKVWYDKGMKPYSLQIGNLYLPFQLFGPLFLAMAIPAASRYYFADSPTAMTDSNTKKLANMVWGLGRAFTDLTFLQSIGQFFAALEGDIDVSWERVAASWLSQVSPLIGFTRYLSMMVDPTYRQSRGFWEEMKKNYPFLTKELEPYRNLLGEEARRNITSYILPYDIGFENPALRYLWNQKNLHLQQNRVINQILKELRLPNYIEKGTEAELEYINKHPQTAYASIIGSLKNKFDSLWREEFDLYPNKDITPEDKNTMYENIQSQKNVILSQIDTIWKDILSTLGKPTKKRSIFDEAEAANYSNDFKDAIKRVDAETPKSAQTYLEQIKNLNDTTEKYKRARQFFDIEARLGKFDFKNSKTFAEKAGVDSMLAEYDYWSSQGVRERALYALSQITGQSGSDTWNTLVSLRKESPGTGNMVLTSEVINDLVDYGYITKGTASQLKKISLKIDPFGKPVLPKISGGGKKSTDLKRIAALVEQRDVAVQKAMKIKTPRIKIPKIKFPKPPKIKRITVKSFPSAQSKFVLRIPKRPQQKVSSRMRSLIYGSRSY